MNNLSKSFFESGWVFDLKTDLVLFGSCTLIALLFGFYFDSFSDFVFAYVLLDQSHIYTTYFFTYNSKRFSKKYKKILIGTPIFFLILSSILVHFSDKNYLPFFGGIYAFIHFYKQQNAWFMIASSKEKKKFVFEKHVEKVLLFLSIAGPGLISMVYYVGRDGWRGPGDLPILPDVVIPIVSYSWIVFFVFYLLIQIRKYQLYKIISWGKHFHLLNSLLIWVIFRLEPFKKAQIYGLFLLLVPHAFPYFYIGIRYIKNRIDKEEEFYISFPSKKLIMPFVYIVAVLITCGELIYGQALQGLGDTYKIASITIYTGVFTHFFLDGFVWKYKYHPEGLDFLKP